MNKLCTVVFLLSLVTLSSSSQGIDNDNFVVTHGPYLQNTGLNGVTIIWTTNKPAVPGVTITLPDGKTRFIRNSRDGIIEGGGIIQSVRIDGLEPGKSYKYSINSVQILKYQAYKIYYGDTITSAPESFVTFPAKSETVSFTVINDVHENSGKLSTYLRKGDPSEQNFYVFNGDMVDYLQTTDQLFTGFIDTAVLHFASKKPFFYVRGNHETRGYVARELKSFFDYEADKFYFSFNYGPVHFTILDCGEDKPDNNRYFYGLADYDTYRKEELEWLRSEVATDAFRNAKHRIAIIHMPVIKEEKQGHGMKSLADEFGPLLSDAGIDLMISAHTHKNAFYEAGKSGFRYPVLVNSNNSFVEVSADSREINIVVKDLNGEIIGDYYIK